MKPMMYQILARGPHTEEAFRRADLVIDLCSDLRQTLITLPIPTSPDEEAAHQALFIAYEAAYQARLNILYFLNICNN